MLPAFSHVLERLPSKVPGIVAEHREGFALFDRRKTVSGPGAILAQSGIGKGRPVELLASGLLE
jgi:hypothetical protein